MLQVFWNSSRRKRTPSELQMPLSELPENDLNAPGLWLGSSPRWLGDAKSNCTASPTGGRDAGKPMRSEWMSGTTSPSPEDCPRSDWMDAGQIAPPRPGTHCALARETAAKPQANNNPVKTTSPSTRERDGSLEEEPEWVKITTIEASNGSWRRHLPKGNHHLRLAPVTLRIQSLFTISDNKQPTLF